MTLVSPDEFVQQTTPRPPPARAEQDTRELIELGDRLVRSLFDTGLRLDTIRMEFDRDGLTTAAADLHRAAIVDLLAELDSMIRTTGLAMLSLTAAAPMGELRSRRRR
ncbi:hypothetical protein [Nocardia sp. XZ_19_369]|uniref:hypothetical protein n=1 Tax=Nocardia sp. XZ_19_369 TaxID=2769487 RepID=UPI00188ED5A1|nr:hypothetical protein [Nocardia sp. XZ_19_369]